MRKYTLIQVIILGLLMSCNNWFTRKNNYFPVSYPEDLSIVKRAQWGWQPIQQKLKSHLIDKITIHHGGVEFKAEEDPLEHLQNLQSWSRSEKKWPDIPYHYMIDLEGTIYEARPLQFPGDTNTDYDVHGHALICVMGNYEVQMINQKQLHALISLSAYLSKSYGISAEKIKGHKDYTETLCPGRDLYRYLQDGTIQRGVTKIIQK